MLSRLWGWSPAAVLMGTIFYISSRPAPEIFRTQYIFSQDKFLHMGVFFLLAFLIARGFFWEGKPWKPLWLWTAIALSALYGISDEVHQAFVPERTSEFADWVADLIGACLLYPLHSLSEKVIRWERQALRFFSS